MWEQWWPRPYTEHIYRYNGAPLVYTHKLKNMQAHLKFAYFAQQTSVTSNYLIKYSISEV